MPSTAIAEYHYDDKAASLYVTYVGGASYRYFDVPEHVYKIMKASQSKGQFVNFKIKPNYHCEKLGE
ncbi:MAG: ATPase protein [Sphingobacteriaceae bacterium]|jgi:hypothetical protein|nr:ATPase protein [Sphingobacteriaceae bacterium]